SLSIEAPPEDPPPPTAPTRPPVKPPTPAKLAAAPRPAAKPPAPVAADAVRVPTQRLSTEELVQRYSPAVAMVRGRLGGGSGGPDSESKLLLENAVNRGLMSTTVQLHGQAFYQAGVSVNPGNSGGPVLDLFGRVLGVVTMKRRDKEGIAFCVPLEDVRAGLK